MTFEYMICKSIKRRFNYTGRKKILRKNIAITLNEHDGKIKSFSAQIKLDDLQLPLNAKVYIEAYYATDWARYDYGTVGNITPPPNTSLEHLAYKEDLNFRILVVDVSENRGKILAMADRIKPEPLSEKKSILPVDFQDIGHQIWKIEYEQQDGGPILIFNKNIPDIEYRAKSDTGFFFFVYPNVLKEILRKIIIQDKVVNIDESDPDDWHTKWLKFVKKVTHKDIPKLNEVLS
ncbi:MAG: hypothetical protein NZ601_05750, partial [candidate division WOR-3 bacterium]|nr:hypothetical protein [candidate division WOR-3 bacterium]MDW7987693.1 hypothetical protein [candidate division WOR-3 bacterium]